MKQFSYDDIQQMDAGEGDQFWFEAGMISSCKPLFDTCADNYEVEDKLIAGGVVTGLETDIEGSAFVANFATKKEAEGFIDRLNAYLQMLAESEESNGLPELAAVLDCGYTVTLRPSDKDPKKIEISATHPEYPKSGIGVKRFPTLDDDHMAVHLTAALRAVHRHLEENHRLGR